MASAGPRDASLAIIESNDAGGGAMRATRSQWRPPAESRRRRLAFEFRHFGQTPRPVGDKNSRDHRHRGFLQRPELDAAPRLDRNSRDPAQGPVGEVVRVVLAEEGLNFRSDESGAPQRVASIPTRGERVGHLRATTPPAVVAFHRPEVRWSRRPHRRSTCARSSTILGGKPRRAAITS